MLDNGAVENLPIFVTVYAVDAADLFHAITNRIAAAAKASANSRISLSWFIRSTSNSCTWCNVRPQLYDRSAPSIPSLHRTRGTSHTRCSNHPADLQIPGILHHSTSEQPPVQCLLSWAGLARDPNAGRVVLLAYAFARFLVAAEGAFIPCAAAVVDRSPALAAHCIALSISLSLNPISLYLCRYLMSISS